MKLPEPVLEGDRRNCVARCRDLNECRWRRTLAECHEIEASVISGQAEVSSYIGDEVWLITCTEHVQY